jgi:hypothetical protein
VKTKTKEDGVEVEGTVTRRWGQKDRRMKQVGVENKNPEKVQGDGEEEREAEKVVTQVRLERNPRPNSFGLSKVFVPQQLAFYLRGGS